MLRAVLGVLVVALASVVGSAQPLLAQTAEIRTDADTLKAVTDYVDAQRTRLGIPGLALGVVVGDETVLVEGFGATSDGAGVDGNTVFLINSISKSITALAVMQLVDAGHIDLDAPVSTYIPELSTGDDVTVRDVMHHRSGVKDRPFPEDAQIDLEAGATRFAQEFQANAEFDYQNANYDILALIVERVGGIPFADYVQENIFEELDMRRSAVGSDQADALSPTQGHYSWPIIGFRPFEMPLDHGQVGSAAMYSSASDIAHLLNVHMNNGVYEGESIVSNEGIAVLHEPRPYNDQDVLGYGGGLFVEPAHAFDTPIAMAPYATVWHDGASPTFRSVMWMTLGPDVGVVLLANGNDVLDESWLPQISYGTRLILSGEEPREVVDLADSLTRWSKLIYLGVAILQLGMLVVAVPILASVRRDGRLGRRGWIGLGIASVVDIAAAVLVFIVTPAVAGESLSEVMRLPDYLVLIWIIVVLIGWGIVRTALALWWLLRPRPTESVPAVAAGKI